MEGSWGRGFPWSGAVWSCPPSDLNFLSKAYMHTSVYRGKNIKVTENMGVEDHWHCQTLIVPPLTADIAALPHDFRCFSSRSCVHTDQFNYLQPWLNQGTNIKAGLVPLNETGSIVKPSPVDCINDALWTLKCLFLPKLFNLESVRAGAEEQEGYRHTNAQQR